MDLGLFQREAAKEIGVSASTIWHWEKGDREPAIRHLPTLIRFLGYVPLETGETLPEKLRAYRRIHGLSRERMAEVLGVDRTTVWRWERGETQPEANSRQALDDLFSGLGSPGP